MNKIYKQLKSIYGKLSQTANFYEQDIHDRRIRFIISFSALGFIFYFFFFMVHMLYVKHYIEGIGLMIIGTTMIVNILVYRVRKNTTLLEFVFITLAFSTFFLLYHTGGIARTGIYWSLIFPSLVFIVKGRRDGTTWMVFYYVFSLCLAYLGYVGIFSLAFSSLEIIMSLAVISLLFAISYIYESVNEYANQVVEEKNTVLRQTASDLKKEVTKSKKLEKGLAEQVKGFEKTNRLMIGRELRIAELKKELSELKKQQ